MRRSLGLAATILCLGFFLSSCSEKDPASSPRVVAIDYINAQFAQDWDELCRRLDRASQRGIAGTLSSKRPPKNQDKSCSEALSGAPKISQDSFSSTASGIVVKDILSENDSSAKVKLLREVYTGKRSFKVIPGQPITRKPAFTTEGFLFLEKDGKQWKVSIRKSRIPGIRE